MTTSDIVAKLCLSRTASVGYVVRMGVDMATSQDFANWACTAAINADRLKFPLVGTAALSPAPLRSPVLDARTPEGLRPGAWVRTQP
ncbi:MAG: hypothetical protein HY778_09995 [Betaproteobacteria bacterium]|nr:hypothetical protein [Betaproteobacteria bacterium]